MTISEFSDPPLKLSINNINKQIITFYIEGGNIGDSIFIPMFYDSPTKDHKILSIGLNPSLTDKFIKELTGRKLLLADFRNSTPTKLDSKIDAAINFQKELKYGANQIPYFKIQESFFKEVGIDYKDNVFHYDLYQKRETDSKNVLKGITNDKQILTELIDHLKNTITEVNPEIIIVFNAAVASLLRNYNGFFNTPELDSRFGCFYYKSIPVILGNQLSGGATSLIYKDILVWMTKNNMNR